MLWCSWVKAATDRSHIKEQLNITRTAALHKYLQFLCTEQPFETRKQQPTLPAEVPGTLSASPDPEESGRHHKSKAIRSWVLRENQGNGVRLPLPPASGWARTAGILQFNLCGLNMGDWCLLGHPGAGRKQHETYLRSMSFWRRCWGLGKDAPAYLSLGERSRGDEGGGEASGTRVPSHCLWGAMPPPAVPWSSSSKAVSQLGAPRFWRHLGCSGSWKWEESLWLWGSVSTWLEQSTHEQLNSRHGFPAFVKRHAANNAAIWQARWNKRRVSIQKGHYLLLLHRRWDPSTFFNFSLLIPYIKKKNFKSPIPEKVVWFVQELYAL